MFSFHSVNSATVLYQWQHFRNDVQCGGGAGKVKISELIFVIRLAVARPLVFDASFKMFLHTIQGSSGLFD